MKYTIKHTALIMLFAVIASWPALAASLADYSIPSSIKRVASYMSGDSVNIKIGVVAKGFAANDPFYDTSTTITKSKYLNFVKGNLSSLIKKNAFYAAWFATIAAAGWAINELTNQVTQPVITGTAGYYYYLQNGTAYYVGATKDDACQAQCTALGCSTWYQKNSGVNCLSITGAAGTQTSFQQSSCSAIRGTSSSLSTCTGVYPQNPISDDSVYNSLLTQMASSTNSTMAFTDPSTLEPYPSLVDDQKLTYIPGVATDDMQYLDWYLRGLAQATDAAAAYYVTPEKLAYLTALAATLANKKSAVGLAADLNAQNTSPLTQAQLDESMTKDRAAEDVAAKSALGSLPLFDTITAPFDAFKDNVAATPADKINTYQKPDLPQFGQGHCYEVNKTFAIMSTSFTLSTQTVCNEIYYPFVLPVLTWFFYIITMIYCWYEISSAFERRI